MGKDATCVEPSNEMGVLAEISLISTPEVDEIIEDHKDLRGLLSKGNVRGKNCIIHKVTSGPENQEDCWSSGSFDSDAIIAGVHQVRNPELFVYSG